MSAGDRPALTAEEQELLTDYATVIRYPGDYQSVSRSDAEEAVRIAERVANHVSALPSVEAE